MEFTGSMSKVLLSHPKYNKVHLSFLKEWNKWIIDSTFVPKKQKVWQRVKSSARPQSALARCWNILYYFLFPFVLNNFLLTISCLFFCFLSPKVIWKAEKASMKCCTCLHIYIQLAMTLVLRSHRPRKCASERPLMMKSLCKFHASAFKTLACLFCRSISVSTYKTHSHWTHMES